MWGCNNNNNNNSSIFNSNNSLNSNSDEYDSNSYSSFDNQNYVKKTSGKNIAKLLLANERLNSELLREEVKIFENSSSNLKGRKTIHYENDFIGNLEINNDVFYWSDFGEYNNSNSYFNSMTNYIKQYSEEGARLIDEVKLKVTEFNKWIICDSNYKYYFFVDAHIDYLCRITDYETAICKHYINDNGQSTYEMYTKQDDCERRIKYIPNMHYEFSQRLPAYNMENYFVADYSKGYWEVAEVDTTPTDGVYNVMFYIMKNDICYSIFYTTSPYVDYADYPIIKVMSSDVKTEIFSYQCFPSMSTVTINLSGFDGVKNVSAPSKDVEYYSDSNIAGILSCENAKVELNNGNSITFNKKYYNDLITVSSINVGSCIDGYIGSIDLNINSTDYDVVWEAVKSFIDETGLECRRDIDIVLSGVANINESSKNIINYYKMNDCSLYNSELVSKAIEGEINKFNDFCNSHNEIKEEESVNQTDTVEVDLSIGFPNLIGDEVNQAIVESNKIKIDKLSYTINDCILLDEGEKYNIEIGLLNSNNDLLNVYSSNDEFTYSSSEEFKIEANNIQFEIPEISAESYLVVAYVSTRDGIRVSEYDSIVFSEIDNNVKDNYFTIMKNEDDSINIIYEENLNHDFFVEVESPLNYEELKETISGLVFKYGDPSNEIIEVLVDDDYVVLSENGDVNEGIYRMEYVKNDGSTINNGYVYVNYMVIAPIENDL